MHPETEIESRRPVGVAAAVRERLAVHLGVGELPVREEQAGVERDATIEEVFLAAPSTPGYSSTVWFSP